MRINARGNSSPQTLTLVEKFLEIQDYNPIARPEDIRRNNIYPDDLNDSTLIRLVADLSGDPKIDRRSQNYTLVEGIMDKESEHLDDKLLIVIKYNFVRSEPKIVVPGMFSKRGWKGKTPTIKVRLLTDSERRYFVEEVLLKGCRKTTGYMKDEQYTGEYEIWPHGIEPKSREVQI